MTYNSFINARVFLPLLITQDKFLGQENTLALIHPSAIEGIESVESSRKEKSVPLSKLEELNQVSKIHF